ncbi:hypothetical protein HII13_000728 [Brettanomyces bruxellensis]|nr:hypothetical protein HII13_000728 [Brettanomyces bruxellensis]
MKEDITKLQAELVELKSLNSQQNLLRQTADGSTLPTLPSSGVTIGPGYVSGSSDGIVTKLAEMQHPHMNLGVRVAPDTLQSSSEMKDEIDNCGQMLQHLMKSLTLKDALRLIDQCHFYLNDIYFPYDVRLLKLKLQRYYRPVTHFTSFLQEEKTYFKPLVLLTIALGKRYFGESDNMTQSLVSYSLMLISPIVNLRSQSENYLVVSVYTMASFYFRSMNLEDDAIMYSNLALQFAMHINLHHFKRENKLQEEIKSRVMWVSFGTNRTLSAKMGNPFILSAKQITRPLPKIISYDEEGNIIPREDGYSLQDRCPNEEDFQFYIRLTRVAEQICKVIYSQKSPQNLMSNLEDIIQKLISWNSTLPENYRFDKTSITKDSKKRRLICSLHLNYCFCIHLTTIPVLYSFVEQKKKAQDQVPAINQNLTELITICINAAEMTVNILMDLNKERSLALFGVMDLDYLYSAALAFFMCGDVLSIRTAENKKSLGSCLLLLGEMSGNGNDSAKMKYQRLLDLINTYRKQNPKPKQKIETDPTTESSIVLDDMANTDDPDIANAPGSPPPLGDESRTLENARFMDGSVLETFQGLTDSDLNIWEDGYRNLQQVDSYWDEFQRGLFDGSIL